MDDLVQWLSEQLDEDERIARATDGTVFGLQLEWFALPEDEAFWKVTNHKGHLVARQLGPADAEHIAAHDPARVLREIDAKRQLLALHGEGASDLFCGHCEHEPPCPTLRLVTLPYSDRPGYREDWRP